MDHTAPLHAPARRRRLSRAARRRTTLAAGLLLPALAATATAGPLAPASADPVPGGPFVCESQPIRLDGLTSNAELVAELERLAAQRPGVVDLEVVGRSVTGRPLHLARVGDGPRTLMVVTQVHGDEPMGTEAALQLLRTVSGPGPEAARLREQVTLVVLPRTNPDGWERYQDPGFAEGIDPRRNESDLDLNRLFGPTVDPDPVLAPEVVAVEEAVARFRPDLLLDYHHQVTYQTEAGRMVSMSVLWATPSQADRDRYRFDPEVAADGRRAAVLVRDTVERIGHATVTQYPVSPTVTTARNGLALEGTPTLLVEQRGQQDTGQKGHGVLVREALASMRGVLDAFADGSFDEVDPAAADTLPARGRSIDGACE